MDTENIWIQVFAKLSDKEDEKKRSIEEIYNLMKKSNIKNRSIEILENDKLQIFTQLINYQASKQNILENIKKIEEYVERKNDLQFKKYIRNFKDYIEIEFKHIDYVNEVKNSIGEVEEFYDKVNENETRVITIKEQVEKTMEKIENSYSVFISILGIFSGIVLVFASGSSIWGSLFKDISKYNWRKIILIIGLSSLVTYNIVFMFIYFIAKLLDRNIATTKSSSEWIPIFKRLKIRYPIVYWYNVIILCIIGGDIFVDRIMRFGYIGKILKEFLKERIVPWSLENKTITVELLIFVIINILFIIVYLIARLLDINIGMNIILNYPQYFYWEYGNDGNYVVKKGEIEKAKYKSIEEAERIIARWQYLEQIKVNIQNFFIRMFLRYPYMSIFNIIIIGSIVFKSYKYLQ